MASSSSPDPLGSLNGFLATYSHDEERHQRMALGVVSPSRFPVVQGDESLIDIQLRMLPSPQPPASVNSCLTQRTRSTTTTAASQIFTEFSDPSTGFSETSTAPAPAGHLLFPEPADQNLIEGPLILFCEFVGLDGCDVSFRRHEFWSWVEHIEEEHLRRWLPESCRCWFCDDVKFKASQNNGDRRNTFYQRMEHIHRHIVDDDCTVEHMRPDFDILRHLYWHNLVDEAVYRWARQYEEGPTAPGTYAYDFIPPEQLEAAQRGQRVEVKETREEQRVRRRGHPSVGRYNGPSSRGP